ncbi:MAG: hypothetical protein IPJ47_20825 [Anaerolineales bacterium]|nr:hypothetical protein [Anaerolineales bacterium]
MNFIKRIAPFEVLLVLVMMGLHLFAATADPYVFPNHWFVRDDSYYYFKVAQNIAAGYGSTFDGINMTNGYHPLWMLICIPIFALAKYDLILPLRVLLMVITVIHTATSVMLYRLVKTHLSHAVAICAAIFWSFNGYIHSVVYEMGLETPIAAFSLVLVIYLLSKFENEWRSNPIPLSRIAWLGFFSALAMFSRLDLVFFAVIIGIWIIFRNTPIRYFLPLDIAIIFITMTSSVILRTSFSSYNTVYAGSGIEVTMIALVIKSLSLYFFGAYQHPHTMPKWQMLRQVSLALLVSSLLTTGVYTLLVQIGLGKGFPRSAFLLDFLFSLILISASRLISAWFTTPRSYPAEAPLSQLRLQWKNWLREGAAYYGILGGLLLFYMIFNHFAFGTSSPVSGQIKRWWGSMGDTAYERPVASWDSYFGLGEDAYQAWQPYSEFFWKASDIFILTFCQALILKSFTFLHYFCAFSCCMDHPSVNQQTPFYTGIYKPRHRPVICSEYHPHALIYSYCLWWCERMVLVQSDDPYSVGIQPAIRLVIKTAAPCSLYQHPTDIYCLFLRH